MILKEIPEDILVLILKEHNESLSAQEKDLVHQWLEHAETNGSLYRVYQELWEETAFQMPQLDMNAEAGWIQFQKRLDAETPPKQTTRIYTLWRPLAVAASFIVLLAIGWQLQKNGFFEQKRTYQTQAGQRLSAILADGTTVHMNSGSTLTYAVKNGIRTVDLDGEAYFDVVTDGRPFEVNTYNAKIRVLGTSFNIRTRKTEIDPETEIFLHSGELQVNAISDFDTQTFLTSNQMVVVTDSISETVNSTQEEKLAWRNGGLYVENEVLGDLLDELERRYGKSIIVNNTSMINQRIDINHDGQGGLNAILDDVTTLFGVRYRALQDGYEILTATD